MACQEIWKNKKLHNTSVSSCCFCFRGWHNRNIIGVTAPAYCFGRGKVLEPPRDFPQTMLPLSVLSFNCLGFLWRNMQSIAKFSSKPFSLLLKYTPFTNRTRTVFVKKPPNCIWGKFSLGWLKFLQGRQFLFLSLFMPIATKHFIFSISLVEDSCEQGTATLKQFGISS